MTTPTDAQMKLAEEDNTWLIAQLKAWPTRVHPERTTNVTFLMAEAAKAIQAAEARAQGLVEALTAVHDDLLMRAEIEGDEKIVAVGTGVWVKVCNALATWRRT